MTWNQSNLKRKRYTQRQASRHQDGATSAAGLNNPTHKATRIRPSKGTRQRSSYEHQRPLVTNQSDWPVACKSEQSRKCKQAECARQPAVRIELPINPSAAELLIRSLFKSATRNRIHAAPSQCIACVGWIRHSIYSKSDLTATKEKRITDAVEDYEQV